MSNLCGTDVKNDTEYPKSTCFEFRMGNFLCVKVVFQGAKPDTPDQCIGNAQSGCSVACPPKYLSYSRS